MSTKNNLWDILDSLEWSDRDQVHNWFAYIAIWVLDDLDIFENELNEARWKQLEKHFCFLDRNGRDICKNFSTDLIKEYHTPRKDYYYSDWDKSPPPMVENLLLGSSLTTPMPNLRYALWWSTIMLDISQDWRYDRHCWFRPIISYWISLDQPEMVASLLEMHRPRDNEALINAASFGSVKTFKKLLDCFKYKVDDDIRSILNGEEELLFYNRDGIEQIREIVNMLDGEQN